MNNYNVLAHIHVNHQCENMVKNKKGLKVTGGIENIKITYSSLAWWHTPLIPALGRQREVFLYDFKDSLIIMRC